MESVKLKVMPKVIQLCFDDAGNFIALCEDGSIWREVNADGHQITWRKLIQIEE